MSTPRLRPGAPTLLLLLLLPLAGNAQAPRPLDHEDYDRWNRIQQEGISPDGAWIRYRLVPRSGDATLRVDEVDGDRSFALERGVDARFSRDARFLVFRIEPTEEGDEEADRNGETVRDSLGILDLSTGEVERMDRVRGFTLPEASEAWVAIHREEPPDEEEAEEGAEEGAEEEADQDADKAQGTDLHYRNLATGEEAVFGYVTAYRIAEDGERLVYAASSRNGEADGVFVAVGGNPESRPLLTGPGEYRRLTLDEAGERAAFLTNRDTWDAEEEEEERRDVLYFAELAGDEEARPVAGPGSPGVPADWIVSEHGQVRFSHGGGRLFFGTAPQPEPDPGKDEMRESVKVDVWSWHDGLLQPHQLNDLEQERRRTYEAVVHLDDERIVQLEDEALRSVTVADRGDAAVALGQDDFPYQQIVSWDTRFVDLYLVDVETGERERVAEKIRGSSSISPAGDFVFWWDGGEWASDAPRGWITLDVATRERVNTTAGIPHPIYNELSDRPAPPGSYGSVGWTEGDERFLVYDAHDIWAVDPAGGEEPQNLTNGYGRANDLRLRVQRLGWDDPTVPLDEDVILSAFDLTTKADGYYRTRLDGARQPERLVMEDAAFGSLERAKDGDRHLFTRRTFRDFPDLWVGDGDLGSRRQLTEANPQQAEYVWGTAELVSWTSTDGKVLDGILYKPDDFDPSEEWPMMVYFYERSSNGLHNYFVPGTGTSISRSFYVSRGYVLFVPDIPYKAGYPGESAMNAVIPGVLSIVEEGYIDRGRIGVQGHSWGGYQISYMVTRTDLFAAAEAGAPVTNMTSAYGGIRWSSGRVRQMQYETGQSRIGGSLWEAQHRYIENSPLFTAYKVETPLLILHNDEDGAVPWEEGIQFFVALRRLGKPVWLINYNGQGHGVSGRYPQLDWTIRMQQFFDHYLKDAPPPVWMDAGVPATAKGRTLGLELVTGETPAVLLEGGDRPGSNR